MSVKKDEVGVFVWFSLETSDVDKATEYYSKLLSCTAAPSPGGHKMLTSKLDADATAEEKKSRKKGGITFAHVQELTADQKKKWVQSRWMVWMAVEDVDASAAQVEKLGGKVLTAPKDIPGVGRYAGVADPIGAEFHVFTPTPTKEGDCDHGAPLSAMGDRPGEVTWVELNSYDLDKVVPFYEALLGWKTSDATKMDTDGAYRSINTNGGKGPMVGGFFHPPSKVPKTAAMWTPYFATDHANGGIEPFQTRVKELGGQVCVPRTAVPDTGFFAICSDPCDALFFLFELPPNAKDNKKECDAGDGDKKRAAAAVDAAPNPASPKKTKAAADA